jgi:fructose/tagatose bisphosphate aldolase
LPPHLGASCDFDRLAAIRQTIDIPLVLHGGSGTPAEDQRV